MKVTVVGCGNSGLVHAAKLMSRGGHDVCLLKTSNFHDRIFDRLQSEKSYRVVDMTDGGTEYSVSPFLITRDPVVAMGFADVVIVMTTTLQHESVSELIGPYAHDGQIILICPGYMGSLIFRKRIQANVTFCEWETTAYNGRISDDGSVKITFYNPRNAMSVYPLSEAQRVGNIISTLFPNTIYFRRNILESAIHNPNMIVHTVGTIFSASRIEHSKGEFWMYKEAFTDSVINVINCFDVQKNLVLQAYNCNPLNYFDAAKWRNEINLGVDPMDSFMSFANHSNKGPSTIHHRYLMEDVPNGLGLLISLGEVAGVDVSIPKSLFCLASALTGSDFSRTARTIQYLLDNSNVTVEDIIVAIS